MLLAGSGASYSMASELDNPDEVYEERENSLVWRMVMIAC